MKGFVLFFALNEKEPIKLLDSIGSYYM